MARIFVSFFGGDNPAEIPLFYESFLNGLTENGNTVLAHFTTVFHYEQAPKCPASLEKQIKDFKPDFAVLFNNNFYDYDFVEKLGIPVFVYAADSYIYYSNKHLIRKYEKTGEYKFIKTGGNEDIAELTVAKENIFFAPFFTSVAAEDREIKSNISFIGTYFNYGNIIRDFLFTRPSETETDKFKNYEKIITTNPFVSFDDIKKNDAVPLYFKEHNRIHETIHHISCKNRIETLNAVADLGLRLYGTSSWITDFNYYPKIAFAYQQEHVYSVQHNQDIYNSSKIGINIPHAQSITGFPWRVTDIMASNALLISSKMKAFKQIMPEVAVPQFESPAEAYELCKKYINDDSARKDLTASHREVIEKRFRFKHFLKGFEEFSGFKLMRDTTEKTAPARIIASTSPLKIKRSPFLKSAFYLLLCCFLSKSSKRYQKLLYKVKTRL